MTGIMTASLLLPIVVGCRDAHRAPRGVRSSAVPPEARRIVCGTPALTELIFALGSGDRIVGISDYTVWPREALEKPRIGGWVNPDRERLLVLGPDIILTQGMHERLAEFASETGILFHSIAMDRFDEILDQMVAVAALIGVESRGWALREEVEAGLAAVKAAVAAVPPRRVAMLFARAEGDMTSLTAIGPGSFLNTLIEMAGGINVFADARGDYPQISKESLLVRQPEVIIELHADPMTEGHRRQLMEDWQAFRHLPAVRDGRIVLLTDDFLLIPGPRLVQTARRFAEAIHPEVFCE